MMETKRLALIAAGIAFYGMFALFPALAAFIALWGLIGDPAAVLPQLETLETVLPADVFRLIKGQVTTLSNTTGGTLGWASALTISLALWSARAGVAALLQGMNTVYGEPNRRGLWHYLSALGMTLALVLIGLVAVAVTVIAPVLLSLAPLGTFTQYALSLMRWIVSVGVVLAGLGFVYRYGPNRHGTQIAWITPGAIASAFCWLAASYAFARYLTNFGSYNEVYGSIGAVMALLMWLYITAFLVLLGAALNAALERQTRPQKQGVTTPEPLP